MTDIADFTAKIEKFDINAENSVAECANLLREMKQLKSKHKNESKVLDQLLVVSEALGAKIETIPKEDPRCAVFEKLFDDILMGHDLEFLITSFAHDVELYCKIVDDPTFDEKVNMLFREFKEQGALLSDVEDIVNLVNDVCDRLDEICENNLLSTRLEKIFEPIFGEVGQDGRLEVSMDKLDGSIEQLKINVDRFVRIGKCKEEINRIKTRLQEVEASENPDPYEKLDLTMEGMNWIKEFESLV